MWLCSSLNLFFDSARSPADMSDTNDSLLVPMGIAFSIWFPIFCLCFAYAVIQALPKNREREIFRKAGVWSAAGFGGVCLWGIINAFAPMQPVDWAQWGTALIFVPTMLCLVKAMLIITQGAEQLSKSERYAAAGLSLIAGWCSIAVFLNWTPQAVSALTAAGLGVQAANIAMLLPALLWAAFIIIKSGHNRVYAFPIIWGLAFVVAARFTETPSHMLVGGAAAAGAVILLAVTLGRWGKPGKSASV
jgi:hypothetical protein